MEKMAALFAFLAREVFRVAGAVHFLGNPLADAVVVAGLCGCGG